MSEIKLIAAIDDKRGLADSSRTERGGIPWDLPSDRAFFREHVATGPVMMGFKTFMSNHFRPYGSGKNYVVSREPAMYDGVEIITDLEGFLQNCTEDIWVVGGGKVFAAALPFATTLYLTRVAGDFNCNVFFPDFESAFTLTQESPEQTENGISFRYQTWFRR